MTVTLAADRVEDIAAELDRPLSNECIDAAEQFAKSADDSRHINRSPTVVAASAIYFASLLTNEKRTQHTVADAAGVGVQAIRTCYQEIADEHGFGVGSSREDDSPAERSASRPTWRETIQRVIGR